jgi:hypothetical protein
MPKKSTTVPHGKNMAGSVPVKTMNRKGGSKPPMVPQNKEQRNHVVASAKLKDIPAMKDKLGDTTAPSSGKMFGGVTEVDHNTP